MTAVLSNGHEVEIIGMTVSDKWLVRDLTTGVTFEVEEALLHNVEY